MLLASLTMELVKTVEKRGELGSTLSLEGIVWFQKISIPPPRRELETPEGWGGQWPRKFQRGGGVNGWINFQRVNFTFMSDIVVQNCNLPT